MEQQIILSTLHSFQHLCIHVLLLAEFLLLLLLHDAVLLACNPPCRVLHDIDDVVQSLLVRADGPHTFGTQLPVYLLPNLPCLQWHRIPMLDLMLPCYHLAPAEHEKYRISERHVRARVTRARMIGPKLVKDDN